jgi:cation:H+ antiporter
VEHVALFMLGLALVALGGPLVVFGSARLDRATGRSAFAVGIVGAALGPCVAGLAFELAAVLREPPVTRLALGHLVGSTIASIGLVLGVAALVRPLAATARLYRVAIPLAFAAAALFWFLTRTHPISRVDAGFLLAAGIAALAVLVVFARREAEPVKAEFASWVPERAPIPLAVLMAAAGLAALVGGGYLTAAELVGTASRLRLPTFVLGETLAAAVTTLPVLVAAVLAARRGRSDLALAVAVGPLLFNPTLVAGAVAMAHPLLIDDRAIFEAIPAMALATLLLVPVLMNGLRVPRWQGAVLVAAYAGFVAWQLAPR